MTSRQKRSKRRSGGNGRRRRPRNPTFLIDQCLGGRQLAEALRARGCTRVEFLADHFPITTKDFEWLAEAGRRKWVVLTKDDRIRKNRIEVLSVLHSKARVFALTARNIPSIEQVAAFMAALPKILRICDQPGPLIATIPASGRVTLEPITKIRRWLGTPSEGESAVLRSVYVVK